MKKINASLVQELRKRTGVSFFECKKALLQSNGDIENSIDNLRKAGIMNAEKKIHKTTNQGVILAKVKNNIGVMIELNCETDFVSKDTLFLSFGEDLLKTAILKKIKDLIVLKEFFEQKRSNLVLQLGENINIRRLYFMEDENIIYYIHAHRIGVLVSAYNLPQKILKNIAMHIAASKPMYIRPEDVSSHVVEREYNIQLVLSKKIKKPENILKQIIDGRMKKFINNISLTGQEFVMNPSIKVGDILTENNAYIKSFMRFELGECLL